MRATLAFICLALVACGKSGGGGPAVVKKPVGPAIDEKTAEKDARGLATELVETLGRGSKDSLFGLFDPEMYVFGPRRGDAYNRTDALVELGKIIDPKTKKGIAAKSSKLELAASLGGRSAWAFDTVTIKGEAYGVTAILVNTGDIWQVEAAVIAPMPTRFAIKSEAGKDAVVPVGATAKGKTDPGANAAVDRYRKGLLDNELFGGDLTGRAGALVIGPGAGEVARGKTDIKEMWEKRVGTKTRAIPSGDIISHVTPDGQLAWVSSPITQVTDKGEVLPMRAFAVFEKSTGEWRLIVLHESLAIDAAGAGTAFKKTLPPVPKEDPKVVVAKKDDDKKPTAKKDDDKKPTAKKDDDKKVGKKATKDDEDEKPKAKKDDKKVGKKAKDDDEEDEKPDPKKIAAEKKKKAEEDRKKAIEDKKAADKQAFEDKKKTAADKKKAEEEKRAEAKKVALEKKKAEDEKKAEAKKKAEDDKKKKAKKSDDDDEDEKPKTAKKDDKKKAKKTADDDDDKPKKSAKKDPKAKKDAVDPDKEYERYPGQKKPKQTEEEQYEERKKARKKAEEDEKDKVAKKKADEEKTAKKKADEEKAKKTKKKDADDEDDKPKKAKKKEADDEEDEDKPKKKEVKKEDPKKKKEEEAKKKKDEEAKKKKDAEKKKKPVEEEDEDRVIAD